MIVIWTRKSTAPNLENSWSVHYGAALHPREPTTMPQVPDAGSINVQHLARLARLRLDASAEAHALADLGNIIGMIDAMGQVDTEGVAPMAHPLDATQRLRDDEVTEMVDRDAFQRNAPETRDGYYLVPRVVD